MEHEFHNTKSRPLAMLTLCWIILGFTCIIGIQMMTLKAIERNNNTPVQDYISVKPGESYELPNDIHAVVLNGITWIVQNNNVTLRMSSVVYTRIVKYISRQLSIHENRCSPWVADTFYPDDNFAVTHCVNNGTFSFEISDEFDGKTIQFSTKVTPFEIDYFLKQFENVRLTARH